MLTVAVVTACLFQTPGTQAPTEEPPLAVLVRAAGDTDLERRRRAMAALADRGPAGTSALARVVTRHFAQVARRARSMVRGKLLRSIRAETAKALPELRAAALAFIRDSGKFTKQRTSIAEMERRVGAVRELWARPVSGRLPRAEDFTALLAEVDGLVLFAAAASVMPPPDVASREVLLARFDAAARDAGSGVSASQSKRNRAVAEFNAVAPLSATEPERVILALTNEHRLMLGLPALEFDERLVRAARGHSEEMVRLRYFAHTSPTPQRRTPTMRARTARYGGTCGENIASNSSAARTFRAWLHSPGHHRNIVGGYRQLGVGHARGNRGSVYTQLFGRGDSLRGRKLVDPSLVFLATAAKLDAQDVKGWRKLMRYGLKHDLRAEAAKAAVRILAVKPDDKEAAKAAGMGAVR